MATHSSGDMRAPRLNPFAFPSDTSYRFILLIIFVVCGSLILYGELWSIFYSNRAFERDVIALVQNLIQNLSAWPNTLHSMEKLAQHVQPFYRGIVRWRISGVVLTLTLATAIYWYMPAWKIRCKRLQPLTRQDQPDVTAYLEHLCREAGLSRVPIFMWDPSYLALSEQIPDALAFGRLGRYYVFLNSGLVLMFYTDQPAFRARVLHELAHLHNADVNKTWFTVALWRAFVVTAILPSVAGLLWYTADWETTYHIVWFGTVSTVLVLLTRNAVLRTREFYADVRASVWEGPSGSLGRVLEKLPPVKRSRWLGMSFNLAVLFTWARKLLALSSKGCSKLLGVHFSDFRPLNNDTVSNFMLKVRSIYCRSGVSHSMAIMAKFLSLHPEPCERRQMLEDTYRLVRLGFWDAFGAGLASTIIVKYVQLLLMGLLFTPELTRQPVYLLSFMAVVMFGFPLFFISLSVGVVGIGVWRGVFAALVRGQAPHEAGRLGLALALGILNGELLLFAPVPFIGSGSAMSDPSTAADSIVLLGSVTALGLTLLFATVFLIFKWVAAAASAWLEVVLYRRSPTPALALSLVIASGSMTVWTVGIVLLMSGLIVYSVWQTLDLPEIPSLVAFFSYVIAVPGSVIYVTSVGLWVFPLAASLWRGKVASEAQSTWAFLEGEAKPLALPAQAPIRLGLALIIGLAVGLMFCALLMLLRYNHYIAPGLGRLIHSVDGLTIVLVLNSLSALMQASAAALAAAWIRRLGTLHGLCSASIAGYVMTLGWMQFFADYGGINLFIILGTGTFLALPVALGVSVLTGWIRRTRSKPQAR
jgi:Zn-dependent protease with chaperone function